MAILLSANCFVKWIKFPAPHLLMSKLFGLSLPSLFAVNTKGSKSPTQGAAPSKRSFINQC